MLCLSGTRQRPNSLPTDALLKREHGKSLESGERRSPCNGSRKTGSGSWSRSCLSAYTFSATEVMQDTAAAVGRNQAHALLTGRPRASGRVMVTEEAGMLNMKLVSWALGLWGAITFVVCVLTVW